MNNKFQGLKGAALALLVIGGGYLEEVHRTLETPDTFVEVSSENPAYFQLSDGSPYIPVGINMINPNYPIHSPDSALREIEIWMKHLSENGGNYVRVWLSQSFWDIEHEQAGVYDPEKVERIDRFIEMARKYGLRIKMTFEHFRNITFDTGTQNWAVKSIYHTSYGSPLERTEQYITDEAGHRLFLNKLDFYRRRYGSDPIFFGWELWNEMNAVSVPEDSSFFAWNEMMLKETKKRFPENLVMQSLGSFDTENKRDTYQRIMAMQGNEVAQIHRYLDLGAELETCRAPMDIIVASSIRELLSYDLDKPSILAETGGVEPRHTGPIRYYKTDTAGMLLHDVLFAAFFSGSAGAGMNWHWNSYVHPNNLWFHFARFNSAIKEVNPVKERFIPHQFETENLRIYVLDGSSTDLIWCRDKNNTWRTEFDQGIPPEILQSIVLDLRTLGINNDMRSAMIYDPWKDRWLEADVLDQKIRLPEFRRSVVVRLD